MADDAVEVPKDVLPVALIKALRPKQWAKQVFLLAALVFSMEFTNPESLKLAAWGIGAFCLVSSCGYVINDILDREADTKHPKKRFRPIASGALPVPMAWVWAAVCFAGGMAAAWFLDPLFAAITFGYFVNTMTYTLWGKQQPILDIMMISFGFLLRAIAGAIAIGVWISPWLILCAGFFALFMGFNKRRGELSTLGETNAGQHRAILKEYSTSMLDEFQSITSSGTIISYALYTVLGSPNPLLVLTVPFPLYGVFRYIFLVQQGEDGDPTQLVLKDKPILLTGVLYGLVVVLILLFAPEPLGPGRW
ncbi:MAG: decaprenyl-phosphate phosphoribosyltransferase [Proteobacteria bacterium]|nr:decaprenyl-phosphate phosphoribosyltransferase [Pseudomonadota bacterium]MCP4917509.1 decaprenyl-phosphate phosphoribosyltransferase [Pseudomonadota bacterium]